LKKRKLKELEQKEATGRLSNNGFEKCKSSNVTFSYEIKSEGFTFMFNRNVVNSVVNNVVNEELTEIEKNVLEIVK